MHIAGSKLSTMWTELEVSDDLSKSLDVTSLEVRESVGFIVLLTGGDDSTLNSDLSPQV